MKVVVTTGPGIMEIQEAARPVPGEGQALIAVEAVGLCGSDFHLYDGRHPYAQFPQIQGHEFTGRIERLVPGTMVRWRWGTGWSSSRSSPAGIVSPVAGAGTTAASRSR